MRLQGLMFVVFVLSLVTSSASFAGTGLSAVRRSGESYTEASNRVRAFGKIPLQSLQRATPESYRVSLGDLNLNEIPEISAEDLKAHFEYIRDTRFFQDSHLSFARRVSWLYPDDGCYIRAEMAAHFIKEKNFTLPKKLFVFGSLKALTKNSRYGFVEWWYHVAVTYRVGPVAYVFDPAINPMAPMTLQEWNNAIGGNSTAAKYAICSTESIDPDSACHTATKRDYRAVFYEQLGFLDDEMNRLRSMNRDYNQELGDNPPWLKVDLSQQFN